MRTLRFDQFGPPSVLKVVELPQPTPSAQEALVEVRAAAINPSDVKNVAGKMSQTELPRTPGRDYAGVVLLGPRDWQGAAVWGTGGDLGFTRDGADAEAVLVPTSALRRKPQRLSFAEAAAVGTPFVTAYLGLTRAAVARGDVVLIAGAAGSVGGAAVQIARWLGADVVGLVRKEEQAAVARGYGAGRVVVHHDGDATEALRAVLGGKGVDVALDTTGFVLDGCVNVIARGGRIVCISAPPDGVTTFNLRTLYRHDARIIGVDTLKLTSDDAARLLDALAPGFDAGLLAPPRVAERPLDDAVAAYHESLEGKKVVLVPAVKTDRSPTARKN